MKTTAPSHWQARCPAFTLIELLATVALLAILAGLAAPSISGSLSKARQTAALSNLRQIGAAFFAYAAEDAGRFPYCWDSSTGQTYAHLVLPYIPQNLREAKRNVFVSPYAVKPIASGEHTIAITYSAHPRLCNEKIPGGADTRVPLPAIQRPSQVILLADGSQVPWNNYQSSASFWNPWQIFAPDSVTDLSEKIPVGPDSDTDAAQGWLRYRTNGHLAALMADGHAELFKKGSVTFANLLWDR